MKSLLAFINPRDVARTILRSLANQSTPQSIGDFNRQVAYRNRLVGHMNVVAMNNAASQLQKTRQDS